MLAGEGRRGEAHSRPPSRQRGSLGQSSGPWLLTKMQLHLDWGEREPAFCSRKRDGSRPREFGASHGNVVRSSFPSLFARSESIEYKQTSKKQHSMTQASKRSQREMSGV